MDAILENIIHLDRSLGQVIETYGALTYLLVFLVIFSEVGLVVTGFLPADSLVFAVGALAATGALEPWLLFLLLSAAAVMGNISNFGIGCWLGPAILKKEKIPFIKKAHLEYARRFYGRHGGKTILVARFLPVIRSFAPLIGGISGMRPGRFIVYSVLAGVGWVALYLWGGYYFGAIPFVKEHFSLVIAAVVLVTLLPGILGFFTRLTGKQGKIADRGRS
ncbi:MAG: VTT domain-containing protein [Chitinispirillaceae bacterium]|nr:VTT domain-containing protein [Chitinispirillaceae bacterium]